MIVNVKGFKIQIDERDHELFKSCSWTLNKDRYLCSLPRKGSPLGKKKVLFHRIVMGFPEGKVVDHIDGNIFNNSRGNLRVCTIAENVRHCTRHGNGRSKYLGVGWHKQKNKWRAYIRKDRKDIHLGLFDSEIEAAMAYKAAALRLFGSFAPIFHY